MRRFFALCSLLLLSAACAATADPTPTPAPLSGRIAADGSSTVGPITQAMADKFIPEHPEVEVVVDISGTGGGFRKFCAGETDISDASRPINQTEAEACAANGIEYVELPVAFDGLAVLTNLENQFVTCLTIDELHRIWRDETIANWQEVRPDFPDWPLNLYGAGLDSGTYDYFTAAIVGEEGVSRMDFVGSEDDNELVAGIAADPYALGFFGLSYYDENRDKLRLVAIDGGMGCVEPNAETVARALYQPLSRPLFIYVNLGRLAENPTLAAFASYYLQHAPQTVETVGYIPLTDLLYELAEERLSARIPGSVFAGTGSQVGLSLADLLAQEK
ncbi:MAG: PstS family phosphate ABC transporter substrate-binding protein [Chloroflexi bacterium]|nr:PstS family phosphate ABC transporter substrate-binding protein [Chloroflexota bacterium]